MNLIEENVSLAKLSTFGIGGPAKFFARAKSKDDWHALFQFIKTKQIPYFIVGKGSNLLFDDRGFDGLIIQNQYAKATFHNNQIIATSGYSFSLLGVQSARKGLSGLEFASGIPGSVGGAVYMNAGANARETKDSLVSVTYLSEEGKEIVMKKEEINFSYRYSIFQKMKGVILDANFLLTERKTARDEQIQIVNKRKKTQPLQEKSAGCAFRNPSSQLPAAMIIEKCGLKGFFIGDAVISPVHANFITNKKNASAKDVRQLIKYVQEKVFNESGNTLSLEIRIVPFSR